MNNEFVLDIDKTVTKLTGNTLGRKIYDDQVAPYIDFNSDMTFIFPKSIDLLGSSFIQGFFKEIVKTITIRGVEEKVTVISEIPNIKDIIIMSLLSKEGE